MISSFLSGIKDVVVSASSFLSLSSGDPKWLDVVFYAESNADWAHIGPVLKILNEKYGQPVTCLTSDSQDPILSNHHELVKPYFIGSGMARTVFFQTCRCRAFVLTLTDLDSYYLKRSPNGVHYFYIFHALVSSHGAYREHAFDAYDTVFCVGPHHVAEIKEQERVYQLRGKELVEAGYCRLDHVYLAAKASLQHSQIQTSRDPVVLVAPTWGPSSMVENCLDGVLKALTGAKITTILRLHPMTLRHFPDLPARLTKDYGHTGCFSFDDKLQAIDSLLQADIMVADHGGSGLEFAFGLERPVISIATPAKIHNAQRERLSLPLFEDTIRHEIGMVLPTDGIDKLPEAVKAMFARDAEWKTRISETREKNVYHVGASAQVMAEHIHNYVCSKKGK